MRIKLLSVLLLLLLLTGCGRSEAMNLETLPRSQSAVPMSSIFTDVENYIGRAEAELKTFNYETLDNYDFKQYDYKDSQYIDNDRYKAMMFYYALIDNSEFIENKESYRNVKYSHPLEYLIKISNRDNSTNGPVAYTDGVDNELYLLGFSYGGEIDDRSYDYLVKAPIIANKLSMEYGITYNQRTYKEFCNDYQLKEDDYEGLAYAKYCCMMDAVYKFFCGK